MSNARWILQFDYTADPEVNPHRVRADLFEQLSQARGAFRYSRGIVAFENAEDALSVRLRFNHNIVAIEQG